ncbi:MAG: isocitrate dehydrogenase (NADP(+)) [Desulfovibrio sp.]|nr:isocitrate dehydrogenase (NADP(+)) [Desulfovibrio sp.]
MGEALRVLANGTIQCPKNPIIPYIPGDGIGPEIWDVAVRVFDTAIARCGDGRQVAWQKVAAGAGALESHGDTLPAETLEAIKQYHVAIKGPLTTPVGKGFRSVNVALRKSLDLYACVRPVRYYPPAPAPVKHPELVDMVIFRENTEDVYAGLEWPKDSPEAKKVIALVEELSGKHIRPDSGIGIKPISQSGSERLIRMAITYALEHNRPSVTLVHKGNIMKYTEGGFREWGYALAEREFGDVTIREADLWEKHQGTMPEGKKVVIKDRICDAMFQQILLSPQEYSVLALPNLNGDYISDALAAQVGGLGMAPGANIGDGAAVFEATHGSSPKDAGKNRVNPSALILSGAMLFAYIGWHDVADNLRQAIARSVASRHVTFDLAMQMENAVTVSCSEFGTIICDNLEG